MDSRINLIRLSGWINVVNAANSSNLSKAEWCRQNNIKPRHLYYWQQKVRDYALTYGEEALKKLMDKNSDIPDTSKLLPPTTDFYEVTIDKTEQVSSDVHCSIDTVSNNCNSSDVIISYNKFSLLVNENTSEEILHKVLKVLNNV